jgi:hypothetical protein
MAGHRQAHGTAPRAVEKEGFANAAHDAKAEPLAQAHRALVVAVDLYLDVVEAAEGK